MSIWGVRSLCARMRLRAFVRACEQAKFVENLWICGGTNLQGELGNVWTWDGEVSFTYVCYRNPSVWGFLVVCHEIVEGASEVGHVMVRSRLVFDEEEL